MSDTNPTANRKGKKQQLLTLQGQLGLILFSFCFCRGGFVLLIFVVFCAVFFVLCLASKCCMWPFTFDFHDSFRYPKIQQNVMIIRYEHWRPSVELHFICIVQLGPQHFYGTFALWILHFKCAMGALWTQNSHLGKLNAVRHISVCNMNNKKIYL